MKTLVTIGRGGTGKSSFTALMAKSFIETNQSPLLLVDADPDQNLAEMLGVDLKEAGKSTIAELRKHIHRARRHHSRRSSNRANRKPHLGKRAL